VRRREFLILLSAGGPAAALAQQRPQGTPLVSILVGGSEESSERYRSGFLQGMREAGYRDGLDVRLDFRYARGDVRRLPAMVQEAIAMSPAVIVSGTSYGTVVAKQATSTTPIVAAVLADPIGFGLIESHSRPGGNVTGVLNTLDTLPGKQLALAIEIMGSGEGAAFIVNVSNPTSVLYRAFAEASAAELGVKLSVVEVRSAEDLDGAFSNLASQGARIGLFLQDAMFLSQRERIAQLAQSARLPTMFGFREHVEVGGLVSYGVDLRESWRRAANFVDRILRGAKANELPVELPAKLELVINQGTAKALGLRLSLSVLARADEVIE
jgi:putative tryptophan/tyrosine transport system substrate-binding protein